MKIIRNFIKWYVHITVGILIVVAINMTLFEVKYMPSNTLWKVLLSGFLTTIITIVICSKESNSKLEVLCQMIVHYVLLSAIMIIMGNWFGWLEFDIVGVFTMLASVAGVYLLTFFGYYVLDNREARKMNERLHKKYHNNE